jgi:transglutaminase-like putative cysteine protease
MHSKLTIKAASVVDVKPYNAFNFLLSPSSHNQLPFTYSNTLKNLLKPCLETIAINELLKKYGEEILSKANSNTLAFLSELTIQIHKDFVLEIREIGEPYLPDETFELKRGSCRDFAWMQIQLLRHFGIAARFASGYFYIDAEDPKFELHGWTEVFLPGAGWIGFDPSNGITTTNMYFPVCSSAAYLNTMPVSGSVRGDAPSILSASLSIKMLP